VIQVARENQDVREVIVSALQDGTIRQSTGRHRIGGGLDNDPLLDSLSAPT